MEQAPLNEQSPALEGGEKTVPNRLMAWAEVVVAALLTAMGLGFAVFMTDLIGSGGIETAEDYLHLTPDFFPRVTMLLLAAVCLHYAVGAARTLVRATDRHVSEDLNRLARAGFMVAVAILYATTMSWLGFILATMLVSAVISFFLGQRRPLAYVPGVVIVPVAIRFVFERLLFIALPRSEIELVATIEDAVIGVLVKIFL